MTKNDKKTKTAKHSGTERTGRNSIGGVAVTKETAHSAGSENARKTQDLKARDYLQNLMEPEVPFISPGPAKWIYPVNLRATLRIPQSTYSHGCLKVSTCMSQLLDISKDMNFETGWTMDSVTDPQFPRNVRFCVGATLRTAAGSEAESSQVELNEFATFPGVNFGSYYPGTWTIGPNATFSLAVTQPGQYNIVFASYAATGVTPVASFGATFAAPGASNVVMITSSITITNMVLYVERVTGSFSTGNVTLTLVSATIGRAPGSFTDLRSFEEVFRSNANAIDLLRTSLAFKISAMSVRLQNSTAELNRGGTLNMAQFPSGSGVTIPEDPAQIFDFLGSAPSVMALTAQPLKSGGHISFVPQDFQQLQFSKYPGSCDQASTLVFSWQNTPNAAGGYYQQDLTIDLKMNVEISSIDPSLRYELRSPLHFDYVAWFRAYEGTLHSSSGCNPDHINRIRENIRNFINHPATRQIATLLSKVAPTALALI